MLKFKLIKAIYTFKLNVHEDYSIYILLKLKHFLKSHSASYQSSYIVRKKFNFQDILEEQDHGERGETTF